MGFLKIQANKFRRNLVLNRATTLTKDNIWPLLNQVGPERIAWLIDHDESLIQRLPQDWKNGLRQKATEYRWAADVLTDEDVKAIFPPWLLEVVAHRGEKGTTWLQREIIILRGFFGG